MADAIFAGSKPDAGKCNTQQRRVSSRPELGLLDVPHHCGLPDPLDSADCNDAQDPESWVLQFTAISQLAYGYTICVKVKGKGVLHFTAYRIPPVLEEFSAINSARGPVDLTWLDCLPGQFRAEDTGLGLPTRLALQLTSLLLASLLL